MKRKEKKECLKKIEKSVCMGRTAVGLALLVSSGTINPFLALRVCFLFCFSFPFLSAGVFILTYLNSVCIFMRMFVRFVYVYFTSLKSNYILQVDYNLKLPTPYWIQNPYFTSFFFFSFCFLSLPMGRGGGAAHYARWPQNVWCFQGLCVSSTHGRFSFPLG